MTTAAWMALLPVLVPAATIIVLLLAIAFHRSHALIFSLAVLGLAAALALVLLASTVTPVEATAMMIVDDFSLFYWGMLLFAALVTAVFSYGYLKQQSGLLEEFYVLLLLATLGAEVLVASAHFAGLFLGLEILSVALYALVAYLRERPVNIEAGVKYLMLAGASSAFLLFGLALIYNETGTMQFARLAASPAEAVPSAGFVLMAGFGMFLSGVAFKLAVVPFHLWTPDVYEGAPAPVTGFLATVSKGSALALLLRFFRAEGVGNSPATFGGLVGADALLKVFGALSVIALVTMLVGNLLALLQSNVKRILAYSSIAHLGYLLVAFLASRSYALPAVSFYLTAYFITTLGAFGVVTVLSGPERDAGPLDDFRGLFRRRPWLAGIFAANLLSLAGIPLTVGFIGKFYLIAAGVEAALWALVITLVIGSGIGLFYYLRIIVVMFQPPPADEQEFLHAAAVPWTAQAALAVLTGLLVWLGVYPTPLVDVVHATVTQLGR